VQAYLNLAGMSVFATRKNTVYSEVAAQARRIVILPMATAIPMKKRRLTCRFLHGTQPPRLFLCDVRGGPMPKQSRLVGK
jgi:hypothetical protein